jgi:hypothetical protein
MPIVKSENVLDLGADRVVEETSDERFDRAAFARRAIDIVRPRRTTVAICEGASRLRIESGRTWGSRRGGAPHEPGEAGGAHDRWALLAIPPQASRRAIALAVAQLAADPGGARAYALDVLMDAAEAKDGAQATPSSPSERTGQ